MLGTEFVNTYAHLGIAAWEAAAVELAGQSGLVAWPWVNLPLADDQGNTAVLQVQSDVLAVGSPEDYVRLPLLPSTAQTIANMTGTILPTPWIAYQIWRASHAKCEPHPLAPNLGPNLTQYAQHSDAIDKQLEALGADHGTPVAGIKKHVVVSNLMLPHHVVIFGWYRPSPPALDVFDDGTRIPTDDRQRQPIQPRSNLHGADYVDYSHGIQLVAGTCTVNGQTMSTADLYQHPTLSRLVSNEGALRTPRYASPVPPAPDGGSQNDAFGPAFVAATPGPGEAAFTVSGARRGRNW